ncbi:MAG: hypothetical protein A3B23_03870 [Candidatus Colwellbacteria bacterium RIFCSPLOWO2_01_FULL_48_10]|uniref:Ribulose-phosphate 3-epimerase n=2 Tax=Bacteria candidate phyla TaxID=1783234 RepID=A0A1F5P328_9BACT|nr:MAG: hypothetical protein A2846_04580 [Candidatus Doudnabacteria bacterium RIFCSPHIGHO2_01_FULL_49_9]OGY60089.1 MAG: hypothetical protein A3B23_03870 [Candidatus Colwellbacteria bacterium RIFCSPLOWO2_01_FULL_48_10]
MQVIPAINCKTYADAMRRVKIASEFMDAISPWVHIDVVDGAFAPVVTWGNPAEFGELRQSFPNMNFEIHLMVQHPEVVVSEWIDAGAKRLVVHVESKGDPVKTLAACKDRDCRIVLSCGPDVSMDKLLVANQGFDGFQILIVNPGFAGQEPAANFPDRIKSLRRLRPDARIEVDGGMNPETALLAKSAGADVIVSASYIFDAKDPAKAYEELKEV